MDFPYSDQIYPYVADISCGIPKGSILGTLLFLIYVHDIGQAIDFDLYLHTNGIRYSRTDQVKFVADRITSNFLKVVFHKFYLVHS